MSENLKHKPWLLDIEYMVLSGGGVKGFAYYGALCRLSDIFQKHGRDFFQNLKGIAGTSIGAFFAFLIAVGCLGSEMEDQVFDKRMRNMADHFIHLDLLVKSYGLSDMFMARRKIKECLLKHCGSEDVTFEELYKKTNKILIVTVTNLESEGIEYHGPETTPRFSVCESVIASMTVPFLFTPVKGEKTSKGDARRFLIDGGILMNFPIHVFPIDKTLGLRLLGQKVSKIDSFLTYTMQLFIIAQNALEKIQFEHLTDVEKSHIVNIPTNMDCFSFDLAPEQISQLLCCGIQSVDGFINPVQNQPHLYQAIVTSLHQVLSSHRTSAKLLPGCTCTLPHVPATHTNLESPTMLPHPQVVCIAGDGKGTGLERVASDTIGTEVYHVGC